MTRSIPPSLALVLLLSACGAGEVAGPAGPATAGSATAGPATAAPASEQPSRDEPLVPTASAEAVATTLTLTGEGLPEGEYTIRVEAAGRSVVSTRQLDGTPVILDLEDIDPADVGVVSIRAGSDEVGPPLLSGTVVDGTGTLTVPLPVDLSGASGQYILATPTNGSDSDERSGIWYVLIPRAPGLVLPALPAEWVYEGWVTIDGVDVTTGRFHDPAGPDDFDGFSGDQGGPPLPGEDFLVDAPPGTTFPVDLVGMTTFVTIEPAVDTDPGPSGLTVLSGQIPSDATDHTVLDLASTVDALPTITVQVS